MASAERKIPYWLLKRTGYAVHYFCVVNGEQSFTLDPKKAMRWLTLEGADAAVKAANRNGGTWHPHLHLFNGKDCAVVRPN